MSWLQDDLIGTESNRRGPLDSPGGSSTVVAYPLDQRAVVAVSCARSPVALTTTVSDENGSPTYIRKRWPPCATAYV
jgi:hypothetical protein